MRYDLASTRSVLIPPRGIFVFLPASSCACDGSDCSYGLNPASRDFCILTYVADDAFGSSHASMGLNPASRDFCILTRHTVYADRYDGRRAVLIPPRGIFVFLRCGSAGVQDAGACDLVLIPPRGIFVFLLEAVWRYCRLALQAGLNPASRDFCILTRIVLTIPS